MSKLDILMCYKTMAYAEMPICVQFRMLWVTHITKHFQNGRIYFDKVTVEAMLN